MKHVFHGIDFVDSSGDGIITGKLGRDIEVMYRRIREKSTGVPCRSVFDMNSNLNKFGKACDRIEDDIRESTLVHDIYEEDDKLKTQMSEADLLRSGRYMRQVRNPILKKVLIIEE